RQLAYYVKERNIKSFILQVNPILDAYLNKGLFTSIRKKWCRKYSCKIETKVDTDYTLLQSEWFKSNGDRIDE
ncbi:MAG: hypothetical protein RR880_07070, partial [Bacteroidales bacterium]